MLDHRAGEVALKYSILYNRSLASGFTYKTNTSVSCDSPQYKVHGWNHSQVLVLPKSSFLSNSGSRPLSLKLGVQHGLSLSYARGLHIQGRLLNIFGTAKNLHFASRNNAYCCISGIFHGTKYSRLYCRKGCLAL